MGLTPKSQTIPRGGPFTVTVTAINRGPFAATGTIASGMMDNLVPNPSVGTYTGYYNGTNPDDFIWRIPSLAVGAVASLVVHGTLRSNAATNFTFHQLALLQNSTPNNPCVPNNMSEGIFTAT